MSDSCVGDFWDGWLKLMRLGIRRDGRDGVGRTMRRAFDDVRIYWGDVEDGWGGWMGRNSMVGWAFWMLQGADTWTY